MRSVSVLLAVALVLGFCGMVQADIVVNQMADASWGSLPDFNSAVIADDFTVAGPSTLTSLSFAGAFNSGGNPFASPALNGFTVKVYANNAGVPGSVLSTQTVTSGGYSQSNGVWTVPLSTVTLDSAGTYWISYAANVTQDMGTGDFAVKAANGADPSYTYVAQGSASYNLDASTLNGRYLQTSPINGTGWQSGTYTGGFPAGWSTGDNSHPQAVDLAFSLSGTTSAATPEPSSIILVCMGLVGLLAYAWRKRK